MILIEAQLAKTAVEVGRSAICSDQTQIDLQIELTLCARKRGEQRKYRCRQGAHQ